MPKSPIPHKQTEPRFPKTAIVTIQCRVSDSADGEKSSKGQRWENFGGEERFTEGCAWCLGKK